MNRFKWLLLILVAVFVSLPVLWPLFRPAFFPMHDYTHVTRLVEMHRALEDGHFPVRWSRNLGYGYGLPQFNFYAPLPYYIAEVFFVLGATPISAIKLLMVFTVLLGFVGMFMAARGIWNWQVGLVAATAFTYAPYRAVQWYVRGALGEFLAVSMITVFLACLVQWYRTNSSRWLVGASLPLGAIVLSHNLTALMSFPFLFLLAIILVIANKKQMGKQLLSVIVMFALAVGISSFYALPAFLEKGATRVDELTTGFSDFRQHFLYLRQFWDSEWGYGGSIFGLDDDMSFEIGKLQIVLGFMAGLGLVLQWRQRGKLEKKWLGFAGFVVLASMLLATFKTQWLWEQLSLMAYIQFPWRFLGLITVFAALMAGAALSVFSQQRWRVMVLMVMGLVLMNNQYFQPKEYLDDNQSFYYTDPERIQTQMSDIIPDFIPPVDVDLPLDPPEERFSLDNPDAGHLDVHLDRTHEFILDLEINHPVELEIHIFDFPGWQIYLEGEPIEYLTDSSIPTMRVPLEKSEGWIKLSGKLEETPIRVMGNALSLVSILIVIYVLIPTKQMVVRDI